MIRAIRSSLLVSNHPVKHRSGLVISEGEEALVESMDATLRLRHYFLPNVAPIRLGRAFLINPFQRFTTTEVVSLF